MSSRLHARPAHRNMEGPWTGLIGCGHGGPRLRHRRGLRGVAAGPDRRGPGGAVRHRRRDAPAGLADRLLLLATLDGARGRLRGGRPVGHAGGGFVAPRVLPEHRRRGVGAALLATLADHVVDARRARGAGDGRRPAVAGVRGALRLRRGGPPGRAGARRRRRAAAVARSSPASTCSTLDQQPELWAACFDTFGTRGAGRLRGVRAAADQRRAVEHVVGRRPDVPRPVRRGGDRLRRAGPRHRPPRARRERADRRTTRLARPRHRLPPEAPDALLGGRARRDRALHLDPGRQHLDAAPQRAPRLRHRADQHHPRETLCAAVLTPTREAVNGGRASHTARTRARVAGGRPRTGAPPRAGRERWPA